MVHFCLGPTVVYTNHVGYSPLCSLNQLQFAFTQSSLQIFASEFADEKMFDENSPDENPSRLGLTACQFIILVLLLSFVFHFCKGWYIRALTI